LGHTPAELLTLLDHWSTLRALGIPPCEAGRIFLHLPSTQRHTAVAFLCEQAGAMVGP